MLQKVILDTNVLVSALIQKSYPYLIVHELFWTDKISVCLSTDLLNEYKDVLKRNKFEKYKGFLDKAAILLNRIERKSTLYIPEIKVEIIKDESDNKIIELAIVCNASYIITGNTNDFTIKQYEKTLIVTPKEYWEKYQYS